MRVNVYAEEMTDRVEIVEKKGFTGLRIYLALPASFVPSEENPDMIRPASLDDTVQARQYQAPFIHHPGDDDSSAVTFWGKQDLRVVLREALAELDLHYAARERQREADRRFGQPHFGHDERNQSPSNTNKSHPDNGGNL